MMTIQAISSLRIGAIVKQCISDFLFKPASARPLAALRIGLSSILLWQAFLIHQSFLLFFSNTGFVQKEVGKTLRGILVPNFNWLINLSSHIGLGENVTLTGIGVLYVISLIFVFCGCFTRWSTLLAWLLHWSLTNTGYSGSYGADMYAHIFLFYLIWIPCADTWSLDRFFKRTLGQPSYQARLGLRALQLHMCISYLASGVEKLSSQQWWNGEVFWGALNNPIYSFTDFHWLAQMPLLPMVGGWIAMAIETFYCVMIWPKKIRPFWIVAICLFHCGIAIFLRLHIFGVLMCIPTLALFAVSAEPSEAKGPLFSMFSKRRFGRGHPLHLKEEC